jgi:Protein of unknown function (DUF1572)
VRDLIDSISGEYQRYRALAEAAIEQLTEPELSLPGANGGNSMAALVWHVAGNLESRFTDFRTSDGEKPWRDRDDEFAPRAVTRQELMQKWASGWQALDAALADLTDADLSKDVTIRRQPLRIYEALHRSVAHTAYHVGQMIYLAKAFRGDDWRCLSIPLGASKEYNLRAGSEKPTSHVEMLNTLTGRSSGAPKAPGS